VIEFATRKIRLSVFVAVLFVGCNKSKSDPKTDYVITEHHVIPESNSDVERDEYTVRHADAILTVRYFESQTNSAPFDPQNSMKQILANPKVLQWHFYGAGGASAPDLTQVPEVGVPIRQCVTHKNELHGDEDVIAVQEIPDPCMIRKGPMLHYEPEPNAARGTFIHFEIVSERLRKQ
jgi:hypothetical protein